MGAEHPLREPSRRLLDAIGEGRVEATTTIEVIQEFVLMRTRRESRSETARTGRSFVELLSPLLIIREEIVEGALRIFEQHDGLGAFDAFLAASAISSNAAALVSADRSFSGVPQLRHVVPGTNEFDRLIDR